MKPLTMKPTNDNIVLEDCEVAKTTTSGIVLTASSDDLKQRYAHVVAVGKGTKPKMFDQYVPPAVKVGEKVLYVVEGSTQVRIDGRDLVLVKEPNIIAVVD